MVRNGRNAAAGLKCVVSFYGMRPGAGWSEWKAFTDATVKVKAVEVPPPGAGLKTVMEAVPALARSAGVMVAVSFALFP
jgi:hypothetical protein